MFMWWWKDELKLNHPSSRSKFYSELKFYSTMLLLTLLGIYAYKDTLWQISNSLIKQTIQTNNFMNFRFKTIAMHQLAHCWRIHFMHGDRADLHSIISGEGVAIQGLNSDIDLDTDQRSAISCLNTSPNYRNLSERENIKNGQLESKTIKLARRLQINSFWYSILHACWCYIYFPCEHSVESICRAWAKLSISLMLGVDSHNSFISYIDCVVQKYSDSHKYLKNF